jgi:hypothetical protein
LIGTRSLSRQNEIFVLKSLHRLFKMEVVVEITFLECLRITVAVFLCVELIKVVS